MTNFEYYKTLGNAINAYEKETHESVYNVHKGVSAGRFIDWLYHEKGSPNCCENLDDRCEPSVNSQNCVPNINYQSLFDEAGEMAYILRKIEKETKDCARCKGDCTSSYSTDTYLKNICEILYSSCGYHFDRKYNNGQA